MRIHKRSYVAVFVLALLAAGPALAAAQEQEGQPPDTIPDRSYKSWSPMPIVMYDTDIGFGFGGKVKFVDFLKMKESFDLIAFQATKDGQWMENWYVFTFSIPDVEIRQGKRYGLSFDLKAEYDKYQHYYFYGLGPDSSKDDGTIFAHGMKSVAVTLGMGISPTFVAEIGYNLRWLDYSNVTPDKLFTDVLSQFGSQFAPFATMSARYDTSDSQIHPTRGIRVLLKDDLAMGGHDANFNRLTFDFANYNLVFGDKDVFAWRALFQSVTGDKIPFFDYASLGGGTLQNSMRGFAINRFLDRAKFLANVEYRFPLFWRLGGNVFVDAGTVGPTLGGLKLGKMALDYGLGLRFYLPDFVVRVDVGFSNEGMGLYFNFGHIF